MSGILRRMRALWAAYKGAQGDNGGGQGPAFTGAEGDAVGVWVACGRHEGLDMMRGRRLSYYPIGRGSMELLADGGVWYTTVNASGAYRRAGSYRYEANGRLSIALGEDAGEFRCFIGGGMMRLLPERAFFGVAEKRLHQPVFRRANTQKRPLHGHP